MAETGRWRRHAGSMPLSTERRGFMMKRENRLSVVFHSNSAELIPAEARNSIRLWVAKKSLRHDGK